MVRATLPFHLQNLARCGKEVELEVGAPVAIGTILDAIEAKYPMLKGTIRDHVTKKRRPFLRFFACCEDWSNHPPETVMPDAVANGDEPFMVVGAIAGG